MTQDLERLRKRYERERAARAEAEEIAERVTRDLYDTVEQLRELNETHERTNLELQAANQTMRDFVAVASHDIRGPVSGILGFAATLRARWEDLSESDHREYVEVIEQRAKTLTQMLDSLLTVSRIEAGALDVHREDVRVADAITQTLESLGRDDGVVVTCPDDATVIVDPGHLQRILMNYVNNAFKYGAPPIEVLVEESGDLLEISVRDRGDGVPPEFARRLFHKFARADTDAARTEQGAGLGLSIVSGLAEANEGEAWYRSNEPQGSIFGIRLPRVA